MPETFENAIAIATAAGARFELGTRVVAGHEQTVFVNTPPSLRELFDTLRTRDGVFLVYEDERLTFAEVMARADAVGHALVHELGVRPGDRVAIGMRNYPEWIESFIGALSVGAVVVCLNAWWTTDELAYGLADSGTTVAILDHERIERLVPLVGDSAHERPYGGRVLAVRPGSAALPDGAVTWDDVVIEGNPLPEVTIGPDADATILYTSGTTGFPKGAVSTHHAVLSALLSFGCRSVVTAIMRGPVEPSPYPNAMILVVPLFHVTGLVPVMLGAVLGGTKLVMVRKWNPERALELIERERVTTFVGVPTMSWDLLESPDFATRDTSSLVSVGGGGAPAPPELVKRIDSSFRKGRPSIGYGMTETNGYGPQNMGDDYVRKPTSAGRTIPTMQVRVVDPDTGTEITDGGVGEIEFAGANLIRGYWNDPDATAAAIHDGWLRSGDLGRIDDEGFVYVVDRAKDMVLRAGENIYCAEVEAVLYEHPSVYEAAVFGIPHERLGEEPVAAVVLRPGHELSAEELRAFVGERLAAFKVPSAVAFHVDPLPRGATGKIQKRDLRDGWAASA